MATTAKTAFIRARVDPTLKNSAESILAEFGITPTQAVTILYKYIASHHEWPIELKIHNAKTTTTFECTDKGEQVNSSKDAEEMFRKLGI